MNKVGPWLLFGAFLLILWREVSFTSHPFWMIGLLMGALLSMGIISLNAQDQKENLATLEADLARVKSESETEALSHRQTLNQLEIILKTRAQQIDSLQNDLSLTLASEQEKQRQMDFQLHRIDSLEQEVKEKEGHVNSLQKSLEDALEALGQERAQIFLTKEAAASIPELINQRKQFQKQLAEKNEQLKTARSELFHTQNQTLALERAIEEKTFDSETSLWLELISDLEEERTFLATEVELLEDLVATLSKKKSPTRKKKDAEESLQLF